VWGFDQKPVRQLAERVFVNCIKILAAEPLTSAFLMAVSAVNRPVGSRLERKLCYFCSAIRAGPIALNHLSLKSSATTAIVSPRSFVKFIEGQIFSPHFPDFIS